MLLQVRTHVGYKMVNEVVNLPVGQFRIELKDRSLKCCE